MTATPTGLIRRALKRSLRDALEAADPIVESGTHIDPDELPPFDPAEWGATHAALMASPEMTVFRDCLRFDSDTTRAAVLTELATYHDVSADEALERCLHWEEMSLREWREAEDTGDTVSGAQESAAPSDDVRVSFYRTMQSWSYDLLWWAYVQSAGRADPASVIALRWLQQRSPGRRHLDFGAGVGVTSQLFVACGWTSTLADLSSTLLDFARFRFDRRGVEASFIDLGNATLPAGAYDAITAIDTLAHVPDVYETGIQLRQSLRTGGYLIANFDIREKADITVWHLHGNELAARYDLLRCGFRRADYLGYGLVAYQRTDLTGLAEFGRVTWAWLTLASPLRGLARAVTHPFLRMLSRRTLRRESSD